MSGCKDNSKNKRLENLTLDKGLRFGDSKATKNVNVFIIGTTFLLVLREIYC